MQTGSVTVGINELRDPAHPTRWFEGQADVLVHDANGVPLQGVSVTGQWWNNSSVFLGPVTRVTDSSGYATVPSVVTTSAETGDVIKFKITNLHKTGYYWDGTNVSEDSETVPAP